MTTALRDLLLDVLERGFDRRSWHGPNLASALRGVSPAEGVQRPGPGRRNIAEQTLHAAYWKYTVRRRLTGEKRGSFALKGSNWFAVEAAGWNAARWRECQDILQREHAALHVAVAAFPVGRLLEKCGTEFTYAALIEGAAAHDVYHAGQVNLIKALIRG